MRLLSVSVKNVLRRKSRSALAAAGVASAVGTAILLVGFSTGFESSSREIYAGHGVDIVVDRAGVTQRLTSSLPESLAGQIAALLHVRAVGASLNDLASFGEGSLIGIPVHGWPADSFMFEKLDVTAGRRLAAAGGEILLGAGLAESLHKQPGDEVTVDDSTKFRVAGVFRGLNMYEDASAVLLIGDLQKLLDRPGQVTEFEVQADSDAREQPGAIVAICRQIEDLRDPQAERWGLAATSSRESVSASTEVHMAHGLAFAATAIAMLIGCVGVLNTMSMSVFERTQEIGVLRAIGWRRWRVMLMIVYESELIAAVGAAVGAAIVIPLAPALAKLPWVEGLIRPDVAPTVIALALTLALLLGLIGGVYPSYRSARLNVVEALQADA